MLEIDKSEFIFNLRLTQAYCEQQVQAGEVDPLDTLRTINPAYRNGRIFNHRPNEHPTLSGSIPNFIIEWAPTAGPYDNTLFAELFKEQLAYKMASVLTYKSEYQGRILMVEYDLNIADGASAVESEGFVDEMDFPPIDTWFYRAHNGNNGWVLFSWVPQQFTSFADKAIAVHFLNILHWFEDWAPAKCRSVMQA